MAGTSITLWPADQTASTAKAYIYVTVNGKDPAGLEAFAAGEQGRFKESSPTSSVSLLTPGKQSSKFNYVLVRYGHTMGNREELVAYVEGPTAYYILVLTADSEATLKKYKQAFLSYLEGFTPMVRK